MENDDVVVSEPGHAMWKIGQRQVLKDDKLRYDALLSDTRKQQR